MTLIYYIGRIAQKLSFFWQHIPFSCFTIPTNLHNRKAHVHKGIKTSAWRSYSHFLVKHMQIRPIQSKDETIQSVNDLAATWRWFWMFQLMMISCVLMWHVASANFIKMCLLIFVHFFNFPIINEDINKSVLVSVSQLHLLSAFAFALIKTGRNCRSRVCRNISVWIDIHSDTCQAIVSQWGLDKK